MSFKLVSKLLIGICVGLLSATYTANAQETHTVQKGETLYSIANQYDISVQELREWNNLQENELAVGETLVIRKVSEGEGDAITHTVEPQETLFSISKEYNVSIAEIQSWNNLSSNNLEVEQKLIIHPSESGGQNEQSIVVDNNNRQSNTYYVVKSGDSLYRIAQEHEMTVDELKQLNGLTSNSIRVGQRLTVRGTSDSAPPSVAQSIESSPQGKFVAYEVSETVSLSELLEKFRMSEEEFRALNSNIDDTTFQSGQELTVLAPPSKKYKNPYLTTTNMQDLGSAPVSKYSTSEKAKPTTSGELYNPQALTAAHSNISLGSVIYIENPQNKKGTYVRINDRNSGTGLKLSSAAWQLLDFNSSSPKVTIYQDQ